MAKSSYSARSSNLFPLAATGLCAAGMYALRRLTQPSFRGKVVVITGGARGLGLMLARTFACEGTTLVLLGRDRDELRAAETELTSDAIPVLTIPCDVREQSQCNKAINDVRTQFGRIDVLINNAGIIQVGPIDNMTLQDFDDAMKIHFWAPLYTMLAALPTMRLQGEGRIVNIASIGGKVAIPHLVPYCASKFALVGLSDGMRAELSKDGIAVTTVNPGLMRTGSHVNAVFKGNNQAEYTWFALGDAMPLLSTSVRRAARKIVEATRRRRARLDISLPARMAILANEVMPEFTARAMALTNQLLPNAKENRSEGWTGWESRTTLTRSFLTRLADREIGANNENAGHTLAPEMKSHAAERRPV
jgi:short-subunit dehydrogenase